MGIRDLLLVLTWDNTYYLYRFRCEHHLSRAKPFIFICLYKLKLLYNMTHVFLPCPQTSHFIPVGQLLGPGLSSETWTHPPTPIANSNFRKFFTLQIPLPTSGLFCRTRSRTGCWMRTRSCRSTVTLRTLPLWGPQDHTHWSHSTVTSDRMTVASMSRTLL